ncbi:MAG: glyoxalase [Chlorobiaceae bacterium]|nr:glyoxalase [Chlorobiaceae bacterium]
MRPKSLSAAFTTNRVGEARDFYVRYFGAKVTFDCGWYVNLEFGNSASTLQFMSPLQPEHKLSSSAGLMYNFLVDDVDQEYMRLTGAGLTAVVPLEDHPWGDRGFSVQDPNGISLYIYSERSPTEEFRQYYLQDPH